MFTCNDVCVSLSTIKFKKSTDCGSCRRRAVRACGSVLDRKLLERLMSPSPKSQVTTFIMFASHESEIFSNFWDSYCSSYGEFVEFSLTFTAAVWAVAVFQRVHYTKIGDAGCIRLQPLRCEPSECGSAHYTKIGDAGVRRRGLWTSLGSGQRWEIGETMNKGGPLMMQNLTWRR